MLEDLKPPTAHRSCKAGQVLDSLEAKDRAILETAIASPDVWPIKTLSRELRKRNIELSETPIANHRNKSCVCFAG
jgi:hypothetical protein